MLSVILLNKCNQKWLLTIKSDFLQFQPKNSLGQKSNFETSKVCCKDIEIRKLWRMFSSSKNHKHISFENLTIAKFLDT